MAAKRQGTETDEQAAVATLTRPSLGLAKPHEVGRDEGFAKSGAHPYRQRHICCFQFFNQTRVRRDEVSVTPPNHT